MSNWKEGYDCGYYEGFRNAIRYIIMNIRDDIQHIIDGLAVFRDYAHAQHLENVREEE
jgi:hypothetical protein